ncbi:MAG TPA: type II toxin-antitoxin system RelE/ParE family toxin [Pseudomonas sp.]|nr:type II toxin-antitoxin system RelE/ParE family toxin [Pseudomonas sp.]
MLPVVWRKPASAALLEIVRYIANKDPQAARGLKERLESAVLPLSEHPYLYRPGRVPGTREIVAHPNYVVVYRIAADHIEILNLLHARQEYP